MSWEKTVGRAAHLVGQYDRHDKFRETEADKSLYDLGEPDEVAIARKLLEADKVLRKIATTKHLAYENNGGDLYGTGVTDGHRLAAKWVRELIDAPLE